MPARMPDARRRGERGERGEREEVAFWIVDSGMLDSFSTTLSLSLFPLSPLSPPFPLSPLSFRAIHHSVRIIATIGRPKSMERCGMSRVVKTLPQRRGTEFKSAFIV